MIEKPAPIRSRPTPTVQRRSKPVNGNVVAFVLFVVVGAVSVAGVVLVVVGAVVFVGVLLSLEGDVPVEGVVVGVDFVVGVWP
jgi:hypothetical protein